MENNFNKHLKRLFLFCPKTNQILEFREELLGMLNEKYEELCASGKSAQDAYNECIIGLDDYKETIKELEKSKPKESVIEQLKIGGIVLLGYILATIIIYFGVSYGTGSWSTSWLVFIGSIIIAFLCAFVYLLIFGKRKSMYFVSRVSIFGITVMITVAVYLILSFILKNSWHMTWVCYILGFLIWYSIDLTYRVKYKVSLFTLFDKTFIIFLLTLIVYLAVSLAVKGAWVWSWLIILGGMFIFVMVLAVCKIKKLNNKCVKKETEKKESSSTK